MIDYKYKDLYTSDSVDKQLRISFDGGIITNETLYSEGMELTQSLCSESELRFGCCEASVLKFKMANVFTQLKDKWLTVTEILDGRTDEPFSLGKYKVYSDTPDAERNYRDIVAYDAMYDIINKDVAEWYEGLEFPITQKDFRDSFFAYFEVEQEEVILIHDNMEIEKTIETASISGKDIVTALCELNGVFGHINYQGNFEYISLGQDANEIDSSLYQSGEYEDFETSLISKLQIREQEGDIGAVFGDGANVYVVEDNFIVYGKSPDELTEICERLYEKICNVTYRPFKATIKGNPCYTLGDLVLIHTRNKDVQGYVLERTLSGIQSLKDSFECKGVYEYEEKVNSLQKEVKQLRGKTNVLVRTVEENKLRIEDVANSASTEILQTSEQIMLEIAGKYHDKESVESMVDSANESTQQASKNLHEEIAEIDKDLQEKFNLITTYISFDVNGLTIGKVDNPYKVIIDNDRFSMIFHNEEVLWIDSITGEVHTPGLIVSKKMSTLGYDEEIDEADRVNCRYVGGES